MVAWRRQERLSDKAVMLIAPQSSSCDRHAKPHNTVGDVDNNWPTVTETQHTAVLAILGWSWMLSRSSGLRTRAMRNIDLVSGFRRPAALCVTSELSVSERQQGINSERSSLPVNVRFSGGRSHWWDYLACHSLKECSVQMLGAINSLIWAKREVKNIKGTKSDPWGTPQVTPVTLI